MNRAAVHEVSHAVVAHAFGLEFADLALQQQRKSGLTIEFGADTDLPSVLATAVAGIVGVQVLEGREELLGGSDRQLARAAIKMLGERGMPAQVAQFFGNAMARHVLVHYGTAVRRLARRLARDKHLPAEVIRAELKALPNPPPFNFVAAPEKAVTAS